MEIIQVILHFKTSNCITMVSFITAIYCANLNILAKHIIQHKTTEKLGTFSGTLLLMKYKKFKFKTLFIGWFLRIPNNQTDVCWDILYITAILRITALRLGQTYIDRQKISSWEDIAKKFSCILQFCIKGKIDGKSHSEIKREQRRDPEIWARKRNRNKCFDLLGSLTSWSHILCTQN